MQCPVLIAWGDKDPWEPIELGRAYGNFETVEDFVVLPDVGHCPQVCLSFSLVFTLELVIKMKKKNNPLWTLACSFLKHLPPYYVPEISQQLMIVNPKAQCFHFLKNIKESTAPHSRTFLVSDGIVL